MAPTEIEPSFVRKHAVRFRNRVVVDAEIDGELSHGRQWLADGKYAVHQQCPNGIRDLPIRGDRGGEIDANDDRWFHDGWLIV
jgi:hypothetical protein